MIKVLMPCFHGGDSGGVLDLFAADHLGVYPWDYLCRLCHHQEVNLIFLVSSIYTSLSLSTYSDPLISRLGCVRFSFSLSNFLLAFLIVIVLLFT